MTENDACDNSNKRREADNRRDFLRKMGSALGGVILAGGGGAELLRGQAPLPSGYNFYPVLTNGIGLKSGANPVQAVGAGIMIGAYESSKTPAPRDVLYFHGTPTAQAKPGQPQSLFRAELAFDSNGIPFVTVCYALLSNGDELSNVIGVPGNEQPILVGTLGIGSANASGLYVTTISPKDYGDQTGIGSVQASSAPGVFLYDPGSGTWTKVARLGDDSPDGGQYGGFFGDVKLNEDGTVVIAAATTAPPKPALASGEARRRRIPWYVGSDALIQVNPLDPADSVLILKTGDSLPGTAAVIESFGLIDSANGDYFVAQANARRLDALSALPGTAVVRGHLRPRASLNVTPEIELLTGSPQLFANGIPRTLHTLAGESIIGPRVGYRGLAAVVTHDAKNVPAAGPFDLHRFSIWRPGVAGRQLIARAGDVNVNSASALGAPVVSSQSAISYYTEVRPDGSTELIVTNRTESDEGEKRVILKSGDFIRNGNVNFRVTEILHGYHPAQVDHLGRIAFSVESVQEGADPTKKENIRTSIVIGIPV